MSQVEIEAREKYAKDLAKEILAEIDNLLDEDITTPAWHDGCNRIQRIIEREYVEKKDRNDSNSHEQPLSD